MRNEQAGQIEHMWWLRNDSMMPEDSDRFYDGMQEWWELKVNKSDREWQDLGYWEVANAAMEYLVYLRDCREEEVYREDIRRVR